MSVFSNYSLLGLFNFLSLFTLASTWTQLRQQLKEKQDVTPKYLRQFTNLGIYTESKFWRQSSDYSINFIYCLFCQYIRLYGFQLKDNKQRIGKDVQKVALALLVLLHRDLSGGTA